MATSSLAMGSNVQFTVTSIDVNHGFSICDAHGHLLGSVQAQHLYGDT